MGRSYLFECPRCGYKAKVSGGADQGFNCCVQTLLCRDCKALYDAVTRLRTSALPRFKGAAGLQTATVRNRIADGPPAFETVLNRLRHIEGGWFRWIPFRIRCPVSPAHKVRPWNEPDKCPKCGIYLEKSALPFRIWE